MSAKLLFKAGLVGVAITTSLFSYAKTVDSSSSFSLKAEELGGGTKASVVANLSFSNKTPLDTNAVAPPYIVSEIHVAGEDDWYNITTPFNCQDWTPHTDTVDFGKPFTQEQECDVTRERVVTVYNIWSNGNRTVKFTYTEQQSDGVITERQATGTRHYITGQSVTYSAWANSGSTYSCSSWTPSTSSVDDGVRFTQTRSCKQNQVQYKKTYNDWTDGRVDLVKTETLTKVVNANQSRSATGTRPLPTLDLIWIKGARVHIGSPSCEARGIDEGDSCTILGQNLDSHRSGSSACYKYTCNEKRSGIWKRTNSTSYNGGNAVNGQPCDYIGKTAHGFVGEAGQSSGAPQSYKYICSEK